MFINTRAVGNKIISDIKAFSGIYSIITELVYVSFLAYLVFTGNSNTVLNVTLLVISFAFEVFLILAFVKRDALTTDNERRIKHAYHITSLSIRVISLCISVYGIHIALTEINTASILFATFMLFGWLSGVLIELFRFVFERYTSLMTSAISKDTEPIVRLYRKITFRGYEGREENKADHFVDEITAEYKKELKEKKESEKALREAEKIIEREERRAEFKEKISAAKQKITSFFKKDGTDEE